MKISLPGNNVRPEQLTEKQFLRIYRVGGWLNSILCIKCLQWRIDRDWAKL